MENLTEREQEFIKKYLMMNDCGAETASDLLADNYSCQTMEELICTFDDLSIKQISGFISSLQHKGVLYLDDNRGTDYDVFNKKASKLPDLYWVSDSFLEVLPQEKNFKDL